MLKWFKSNTVNNISEKTPDPKEFVIVPNQVTYDPIERLDEFHEEFTDDFDDFDDDMF
ncbi:hypothetical protein [Evansella tamaricis]|uniref:hypothetical protein n=1 Tax=Evansella tamaricis TaxID=2069301 RepID=UPI00362EF665